MSDMLNDETDGMLTDMTPPASASAKTIGEHVVQQLGTINANEVVSSSIAIAVVAAVMFKFTMLGGGMTRGWTPQEIAVELAANSWTSYMHVLSAHPIATKAVTSGTVYALGDTIAQKTEGQSMATLDQPRILRSAIAGFIGHGPMSHFWYQVSEEVFSNILHLTQWWSFVPKVVVDQTLWGPIWNNSYIVLLGLMKMQSPEIIWGDMKRTTIPLILSGLKLWPLAHCVTYGLIPVENRLLWVDAVEIIWVTILASQAADLGKAESQNVADSADAQPALATADN